MSRNFKGTFNMADADNYGSQGGGFFSLRDDKDTAIVRFMYNGIEDVQGYAVHEVEVGGKKRYVACLRHYSQPISDCPLCEAQYRVIAKLFLFVYDEETQELKIWDRGKSFFSKISSLCARYNPLVSTPFEVERNGKRGDTNTTYETYALEKDDIGLEDLPEVPDILGSLVLDKSFEEMQFYLTNGYFEAEIEDARPPIRNPQTDRSQRGRPEASSNEMPVRRTPTMRNVPSRGRSDTGQSRDVF